MSIATPSPQLHCTNLVQWTFSGDYDPRKPVLIDAADPSRIVTKEIAIQLVTSLVGAFEPDSTVCLHLTNDIIYPILCLAIWANKCRWTGTNPAYTASELAHHFRVSKTKYIVTAVEQLDTIRAAVADSGDAGSIKIILFSDILHNSPQDGISEGTAKSATQEFSTLHDLLQSQHPEVLENAIREIDENSLATLCPTSGTTGMPKMAAHTHLATVIESAATQDHHASKPYVVRRLFCTPIFHSFSTPEMVINSIRLGIPSYFMKRFNDAKFSQAVHDFAITETFAPPPILLRLVNNPETHPLIQSLRNIYSGGAPLVQELRTQFESIFQHEPPRISQVWGMTEGGWYTTIKHPEVDPTNSCGRPIPGYEIRISDHHATEVDGHRAGEIYVRGPALMRGYYGNAQATADSFDGDWLKTGDVGYIDAGKVYLVDRCKDLIKVNGFQVTPAEIENALLTSPDVRDCGVVGWGENVDEHPLAFVVPAHVAATVGAIKAHLLQRLTRYKVASCEVRFVDRIPKSISGKILKKELRNIAASMQ
jgi:acyl-coenzyme A synthetase/AMP-(fatty) acid ligase